MHISNKNINFNTRKNILSKLIKVQVYFPWETKTITSDFYEKS